jgi:hypothetical protein
MHPDTRPLARWIEAIAAAYDSAFATPTAFAFSLAALIIWLVLIPFLGFSKWNSGPGLLGNTLESTGEWFFGLAVLIVGVSTATRQQQIESNQLHQMDHIKDLQEQLGTALAENTLLTQQIHELVRDKT